MSRDLTNAGMLRDLRLLATLVSVVADGVARLQPSFSSPHAVYFHQPNESTDHRCSCRTHSDLREFVTSVHVDLEHASDVLVPDALSRHLAPNQCDLGGGGWILGCGDCVVLAAASALSVEEAQLVADPRLLDHDRRLIGIAPVCGGEINTRTKWFYDEEFGVTLAVQRLAPNEDPLALAALTEAFASTSASWTTTEFLRELGGIAFSSHHAGRTDADVPCRAATGTAFHRCPRTGPISVDFPDFGYWRLNVFAVRYVGATAVTDRPLAPHMISSNVAARGTPNRIPPASAAPRRNVSGDAISPPRFAR